MNVELSRERLVALFLKLPFETAVAKREAGVANLGERRCWWLTMRQDLRKLTESIREGKVTERKKAVEDLQRWFRQPQNVSKIGGNNEEWIEIFEALSIAAKVEHDAANEKSTKAKGSQTAVQTKLENISAAFRAAVEASIPYLNNASLEFLVPRLVSIIKMTGAILEATGTNYARTLLSIAAHPPHTKLGGGGSKSSRRAPKDASSNTGFASVTHSTDLRHHHRHLCASPFAPIIERDRRAVPEGETNWSEQSKWAYYLLVKFCRYFEMYQGSVTSHVDMVPALCFVLEQVELNRVADMMWFSRRIWPSLVALMKGRVRTDYVQLIVVFKIILPYYVRLDHTLTRGDLFNDRIDHLSFKGLSELVQVIQENAPLKAGLEPLQLEGLRLEFMTKDEDAFSGFRAKAFRYGRSFTPSQAHAWTMLELQADCIFYLYRQEETTPQSQAAADGPPAKRRRSENALEALIRGIPRQFTPGQRWFGLQVLLFVIEKWWDQLDAIHQQLALSAIMGNSAANDSIDGFSLLCLTSVVVSSNRTAGSPTNVPLFWENIWYHAYRRLGSLSTQVARAAAHLLDGLLELSLLDPGFLGKQITQFIRDFREDEDTSTNESAVGFGALRAVSASTRQSITIHTFSESSCALLSRIISIADADATLCRLRLDDAVRRWLRRHLWRLMSSNKQSYGSIKTGRGNRDGDQLRKSASRIDSHITAQDLLALLQATCGISKGPTFKCESRLPDDSLVRSVLVYQADRCLRQLLISAIVPPFATLNDPGAERGDESMPHERDARDVESYISMTSTGEFAPSARESRTVALLEDFMRFLRRAFRPEEEGEQDVAGNDGPRLGGPGHLEKVLIAIKASVAVLGLQSSLELNGTRPSRDLYHFTFSTLQDVIPWTLEEYQRLDWTSIQWAETLTELRCLVWGPDIQKDLQNQRLEQLLLRPGNGSGIRRDLARRLRAHPIQARKTDSLHDSWRLLGIIWANKSAVELVNTIDTALEALLQLFVDKSLEQDGFGQENARANPFSDSGNGEDTTREHKPLSNETSETIIVTTCFFFIATTSFWSKGNGSPYEATRMEQMMLEAESNAFLALCEAYCRCIQAGTLHVSPARAKDILSSINQKLKTWNLWRSESMHQLVFKFLDTLSFRWLTDPGEAKNLALKLFPRWTEKKVLKGGSWRSRMALSRFMGSSLLLPSFHAWWKEEVASEPMDLDDVSTEQEEDSFDILGDLLLDGDIRVRTSASIVYAATFEYAGSLQRDAIQLYSHMTSKVPGAAEWFEGTITRFIALTNTFVVSSPVRRGAYWHLMEITLDEAFYTQYLVPLLSGAAARLGLRSLSALFRAFAAQLSTQIADRHADFIQLPPRLLGFRTHKECADALFSIVAPTVMSALRSQEHRGPETWVSMLEDPFFSRYCKAVGRDPQSALRECFAQIVAISVVFQAEETAKSKSKASAALAKWLSQCARDCDPTIKPEDYMKMHVDDISAAILCYVGDTDFHPGGSIHQALQRYTEEQPGVTSTFETLHRFRKWDDFPMHMVTFPAATTDNVLKALTWFTNAFVGTLEDGLGMSTIYHAIHHLFSVVNATPLVNEQLRYINSLTIWLSISAPAMDRPPMIHSILTHSIALLSQEDLLPSAQSMISFALESAKRTDHSCKEIGIGTLVGRTADLAVLMAQASDSRTAGLGESLLVWIRKEAQGLAKVKFFRKEMRTVLALWPRDASLPSQQSDVAESDLTNNTIQPLLRTQATVVGRFRAARHLNAIPGYLPTVFAGEHFWALKDNIPDDRLLLKPELDAFMDLLSKGGGKVNTIRIDAASGQSLSQRQRDMPSKSVKGLIAQWLVDRIGFADADSLDRIHTVLRRLCHPICEIPVDIEDDRILLFRVGAKAPLAGISSDPSVLKKATFRDIASKYSVWIRDLAVLLCNFLSQKDIFFAQLPPLLGADAAFASELLPLLIHQLLLGERQPQDGAGWRSALSDYLSVIMQSTTTDILVQQTIVGIVVHLRHLERPGKSPIGYDKWLNLSFMELCQTSLRCGAYTTALLFLELAHEYRARGGEDANAYDEGWEKNVQDALYDIYRHVDEPDGFYAISGQNLSQHLMHKFQHETKWDKAFQSQVSQFEGLQSGIVSSQDNQNSLSEVIESLHSFGFSHLAMSLARGTPASYSEDTIYSLAWRTEAWDLPQVSASNSRDVALYAVIRSVHRGKSIEATRLLCEQAARKEMQRLRVANQENVVEIRRAVQDLLCLREVDRWLHDWRDWQTQPLTFAKTLSGSSLSSELEFSMADSLVATRISLLHSLSQSIRRDQVGEMESGSLLALKEMETRCLVELGANARNAGMPQVAFNAVSRAQNTASLNSLHVSVEFAEALWALQEPAIAIQSLTELIRKEFTARSPHPSRSGTSKLSLEETQEWAQTYARLGFWTSEACLANPQDIKDQWFDPGVKLLGPLSQAERSPCKMVYYQYAAFSDRQLRQMESSEEYELRKQWMKKAEKELDDLQHGRIAARSSSEKEDMRRRQDKATRLLDTDRKNLEAHESALKSFLEQAISMYAHYMEVSTSLDQEVAIRFCGLWFAYFDNKTGASSIKQAIHRISTHKFVFLAHQLTARLGMSSSTDSEASNYSILKQIVQEMCLQHPYHSLLQILTLRGAVKGMSEATVDSDLHTRRRGEAKKIIETVRKTSGTKRQPRFMETMEEAFAAYIDWASLPIKALGCKSGTYYPVPKDQALFKWVWDPSKKDGKPPPASLPVPVATANLPVEPSGKYADIPTLVSYDPHFTVAGGVHIPKINSCRDSLGRIHKQLFKGEGGDDLRQDAVMEQVFELVNTILTQDRESRRRNLSLRTYKVIPLPNRTGLLQFIVNTEPLASWLPPAHSKYYPEDLAFKETQTLLKQQSKVPSLKERAKILLNIRARFRPVLRYFFTESNKQPVVWHAKRLTYARSVATCSIVGHVLGLGDRHMSNLLMDARTGEMIHIDLGIAFDQGRLLPVPELVPFRLTADVVDGMGIAGTEGVFRKCSEHTLRVLRDGSDIIKTVLEVFKYDPLHSWTAPANKLRRVQEVDNEEGIGSEHARPEQALQGADRAIASVARKLDKALSVEYTVNELITEARDINNLARIFYGWSPQC